MSKLKNTKKGMAKKALSVSLVAAMLATSNVPVWAAEFGDGTDVVDTFTDEITTEAGEVAPVADEAAVSTAAAQATDDTYTVNPVITGTENNSVIWENSSISATFTVEGEAKDNVKLYYAWRIDGKAAAATEATLKQEMTVDAPALTGENAGSKLDLYIYAVDTQNDNKTIWSYTSDSIAIKAVDETAAMAENITGFKPSFDRTYNGKEIKATKDDIEFGNTASANYDIALSGETTNVTDDGVDVTITANRPGYTGQITLNYTIDPMELGNGSNYISERMEASLNTTSFVYTGNAIRVKASDVTLKDKETKADLSNYLKADKDGYVSLKNISKHAVGETTLRLNLIEGQPETGNKNYTIAEVTAPSATDADGCRTIETSNKATITARKLDDVNITIKSQSIPANGTLTLTANDVTFKDAAGNELNLFEDLKAVTVDKVTSSGTYDVTFEPKSNNENVTGKKAAQVVVVKTSLADAVFDGTEAITAEEYTGEAVTKTAKQLGQLKASSTGNVIDATLYDVTYSNNINAGIAKIIVTGKGDYAGSVKEFTFTINPAAVTDADITANKKVEYKETSDPAAYADSFGLVVKAKNAKGKEFTLAEGTDYTVKYSFDSTNEVGQKVKAAITIKNDNFKGNTTISPKEATIANKAITSDNIKLRQSTFTYTGKAIIPEFDVVIDGMTINPDLYKYEVKNNLHAGTATLTVKGKGDKYDDKEASVTFTINPADVNSLEGVIASKEYTGYSLELAEDDFNLTLNKERINVRDNFKLTYGANIEIGEGTVTLTPKNSDFTGSKTFTFQITAEMLNGGGRISFYDENGIEVGAGSDIPSVTYDGTAHQYAKTEFTYRGEDAKDLVEGRDYEIKYVDNIYGKEIAYQEYTKGQYIAVLAVAKGKYGSTFTNNYGIEKGIYTDAEGNKIANVIAVRYIKLDQLEVHKNNVLVSNGTYAAGLPVKPVVDIVVNGVVLKEGQDYDLNLSANSDVINVTSSKSLKVTVKPKNGYKAATDLTVFNWGIDKFNLANAAVSVDGDNVIVKCGRVDVEASEYTVTREGDTLTVTASEKSKNYTGSKTINVENEDKKPAAPMIVDVQVTGNNATAVLSGDSDGATGYDYVISKDRDCITNKDYDKVNKNILTTKTTFTYTQQGTYYAYCHAWKRVNGVKVFSDWSNAYPFVVTAITPEQPGIQSVKVSGSTVKVTYTKCANATGYDVVLGSAVKKVNGENRPVEYGTLVSKVTKGSTVTATFKNVKKGTYYAGLHAYNRTSEDGKKVFSPWSNTKKVTVK